MENKIILDCGSYYIRYGFIGYNNPIGKIRTSLAFDHNKNIYISDLNNIKENYSICNPIKNGIIINYDEMEFLWNKIFFEKLKINPKNCYILITSPIFFGEQNKKKIKDIMLKKYLFKDITFVNQQILSLFGNGRNRGLVIDIGHDSTKIVPIYDNCILKRGIIISPICKKNCIGQDILKVLLDPSTIGLDTEPIGDMIVKSVELSPIDLRKILYQNILIIGGGSLKSGIGNIILKSIRKAKHIPFKIKISAPRDRDQLTWIGGSIYGCLC